MTSNTKDVATAADSEPADYTPGMKEESSSPSQQKDISENSEENSDNENEVNDLNKTYTHSLAEVGPDNTSEVDQVSRISRSLTNSQSLTESARKSTAPLPPMGGGRAYPPALPDKEQYVVSFEGKDDPLHPFNWPSKSKIAMFVSNTFVVITIAFGSSIFSTGTADLMKEFHVGSEVITLGTSLYVLGFATGPIVWAPLSELYGRKPVLLISIFLFTCFQFAIATAKDLQTIMISRFFGSCLGSAPLVVVGAAFADMYDNRARGKALSIFSLGVVLGPQLAPIVGGYISASYLGWRWTEYITGIMGAVSTALVLFIFKETHYPILLVNKAEELRRRTGNWGIRAAHEEFNLTFSEIVEKNVSRPLVLLFTEPILFLMTLYVSFVYGIIYLCLTAYPLIFQIGYGWKGGKGYLPYIAMVIGQIFACLWILYKEGDYIKAVDKNNGKPVPEARLPAMIPGAICFPIGLLWLCWTGNYPDKVHWAAPVCSGIFTGFGLMAIFLPSMNYIVDCYLIYAASAMAANAVIRSLFGAAFPLFGSYMFNGMGINWAGLLLGLFGAAMAPVPFLFLKYGKRIRAKSKYSFDL